MTGVVGLGVDLVELPRFAAFLRRHGSDLGEVFTARELELAELSRRREVYLATRWALKEAVLKAVGTGWGRGIGWTEVESLGGLYSPEVRLHGVAARLAGGRGGGRAKGTVSVAGEVVVAMAMLGE
jgi:holo-[acyl-carrier protein] synthase